MKNIYIKLNKLISKFNCTMRTKKLKKKYSESGVTFVETIIVIAIFIILSGTIVIVGANIFGKAKLVAAKNHISSFEIGINMYLMTCKVYPTQDQGLQALVEKPVLEPVPSNWTMPFLNSKKIPKDPWERDYIYRRPGPNNLPYEIISLGADGLEGGEGDNADISSWE